ncbi:MAG: helix-turn-helix transcriptional regulator [Leptolyngbyaceae cyanobacterium CSU_1_4]|nr:helix-turn-helix transcriptional regulator [Leptolyngbyaceae cyanobacterium CSU_1_4]
MSQQLRKERLSQLLIDYCGERNLSGNKLAKELKVSPTSAQAYLDGVTFPGEETRQRIADLLNITYEELSAKLDDQILSAEISVDEICQEVRAMKLEDFLQVYRAVVERAGLEIGDRLKA